MAKPLEKPSVPDLYEEDFFAWTQEQAAKLRTRTHNDIDWDNLAEEIESVGLRELREIREWYAQLLEHLLLWEAKPHRRCHSWQTAIGEARIFIDGKFELSPSLFEQASQTVDLAYGDILQLLPLRHPDLESELPEFCPWSVEQLADYSFMPGKPWSPDELLLD